MNPLTRIPTLQILTLLYLWERAEVTLANDVVHYFSPDFRAA